jgi:hypothetical protein
MIKNIPRAITGMATRNTHGEPTAVADHHQQGEDEHDRSRKQMRITIWNAFCTFCTSVCHTGDSAAVWRNPSMLWNEKSCNA